MASPSWENLIHARPSAFTLSLKHYWTSCSRDPASQEDVLLCFFTRHNDSWEECGTKFNSTHRGKPGAHPQLRAKPEGFLTS